MLRCLTLQVRSFLSRCVDHPFQESNQRYPRPRQRLGTCSPSGNNTTKPCSIVINSSYFQYTTLVKPAFEEFCIPTKKYADVIIPRGAENTVAIDLISQHMQDIVWRSKGSREESPSNDSRSSSSPDCRLR